MTTNETADSSAVHRPACHMGVLLRLPPELEQQFWSAAYTQRFLLFLDTVAGCMPIANLFVAAQRRLANVPAEIQVPFGAKLILFVYISLSVVMLALLWLYTPWYLKHRVKVVAPLRLWRLAITMLLTHHETVLGYGTQTSAVGKAALGGNITRALMLAVCVPTAMHLQHTNLHLSFQYMLPLQLGNFVVAVMWAQGMPCWLSSTAAAASTSTKGPALFGANLVPGNGPLHIVPAAAVDAAATLQDAATQACEAALAVNNILWLPTPLAPLALGKPHNHLCQGPSAFQLLYVYVAALLLVLLPLCCGYALEYCAKVWWLKAKGITLADGHSSGAPSMFISGVVSWQLPLFLLLLQLPWCISVALAATMNGTCSPALGGREFNWMRGLW